MKTPIRHSALFALIGLVLLAAGDGPCVVLASR